MDFVHFFKALGHRLGQALGYVAKHVTDEQLAVAIEYVTQAEDKFADNALRRRYVLDALQKLPGVNENAARLLTEIAVGMVKKQLHHVTEVAIAAADPR